MMDGRKSPLSLIQLFVRHPTASNLLMITMLVFGAFSMKQLNTQFYPTLEIPTIIITVPWPGASAADVEANILESLEPELRFLDDVDKIISIGRESAGVITIEFNAGADMQKAQSDIQQAISSVTTLPEDSEEPIIKRITFFDPVADISISGPFSEQAIKAHAKTLRDGLLAAGIDRVDLKGEREEEIWVTVSDYHLRRLGLSLGDIAERIRQETRDLPAGVIEGDNEIQLRTLSQRKAPETIGNIEIRAQKSGQKIRLREIAEIAAKFDRDGKIGRQRGEPAINLEVKRAVSADTLKTMALMEAYIRDIRPTLPPALRLEVYNVRGKFVRQRLGILINNGLQGLVLVLAVLFLFLNARVAFWVAIGIPVAFMATLTVMWASEQSMNMISMFALIMMLGIIVDDAIVVGEHTATRQQAGERRLDAAERGASKMLAPVLAATLTTQAAFLPIFFISGRIGDVMFAIPLVVMAVLIASIIECFLILPGHLRHGFGRMEKQPSRFRKGFDELLEKFRDGPYRRFVTLAFHWRYTTIAVTLAALMISIGLIAGGRLGFHFFPSPEPENVVANLVFAAGTPRAKQIDAIKRLEGALLRAEKKLVGDEGNIIVTSFATVGSSGWRSGDNLAEIDVQLTPSEERLIPTQEVVKAWRQALPEIVGVEQVTIRGRRAGPPGRDIDILLQSAPISNLKQAAIEVKAALTAFPGVSAISDDLPYGKQELIAELTARGTALGFTSELIGLQLRTHFEGAIATRFARGNEEITVRVLGPQKKSGMNALNELYVRTPAGLDVPLTEIVKFREKKGFSVIQRRDGVRTVSVTANIDARVTSNQAVLDKLQEKILPALAEKHHLKYTFSGRAEERANSFRDLKTGALVALILIYIILAWVFESYAKPLAVMAIIPFGLVGAILGHMVMGFHLTIISLIGLLGLSGILVNDSIILVSQVKERLIRGNCLSEAAIGASQDRLRAVVLTSLTTIGGLLPLLFETSRQAQFLIPMAITLIFGLAAATLLVLLLVPALIGVGSDVARLARLATTPFRNLSPPAPSE